MRITPGSVPGRARRGRVTSHGAPKRRGGFVATGVSAAVAMVPRVQLPPEIQLAQRLAGNEQVTRDRAVRKLRKYIVARTQQAAGGFTHDELLKVWKGLFYCMWMQDKPLLQEELGRTISQLIHAFQTAEAQHLFLQTFWQTMNREWTGIDRLRLDKFYMLMRMVLNESLKALKTQGWEERHMEQLLVLLTTEILHPDSQAPNGVKSHFIEIFLEELAKVGADELTADQNLKFIEPFCRIAAQTKDSLVLHNITRSIFETIVEQAPFAIEDLMNEMGAEDLSEGDEQEPDELSEKLREKPTRVQPHFLAQSSDVNHLSIILGHLPPGGRLHGTGNLSSTAASPVLRAAADAAAESLGSSRGTAVDLDEEQARGDEDSTGPVLQFDYEAVANRLFEVAGQQDTPSLNRKRLYKVIRKLQDLAEGLFPEDDIPEKAARKLQEGRRGRKTTKRLPKCRLQNKTGRDGQEDLRADPRSGFRRTRQDVATDLTAPQEQTRARGRRGARRRQRRPRAGARAKVTGCQEPEMKKKRIQESKK